MSERDDPGSVTQTDESEQRYRTIAETVSDAIVTIDADSTIRFANPAVEDVFGYAPEELIGESLTTLLPDRFRDRHRSAVDRFLDTGERTLDWSDVEFPGLTKDGEEVPLSISFAAHERDGEVCFEGVMRDITARKARERELERTRELLRQAERVAQVGGWELDVRADPPELTWSEEVYRIHDLPPDETVDLSDGVGFYHPEDRPRIRECVERALDRGEEYDVEARLITAEGTERWVRAIGVPTWDGGEVVGIRGSIQDITDRKEREFALESLQEASLDLLGTTTRTGAAELVVETATGLLDDAGVGLYLLDAAESRLAPTACTPAFGERTAGGSPVPAGEDSLLWESYVTGTTRVLDPDADRSPNPFGPDVVGGLVVPLGDHGVFVLAAGTRIDGETRRLAETLVATAAAAFDRIESETSLKERDAELEERTEQLRRQTQITDIVRRIDRSLVGATAREEMEAAICEELVAADAVTFAWIGGLNQEGDAVEPRAWAGGIGSYLDSIPLSVDARSPEPAAVAASTGDAVLVSNVVEELDRDAWHGSALERGLHSVVAVPLFYEDYSYGVLAVYGDDPGVFGERERSVFAELGETIAHSINAVEARQALRAGTLIELTLELAPDEDVLGRIATAAGCRIDLEGLAVHSGAERRVFVSATDADPAALEAVLADLVSVRDYRSIADTDDGGVFEITVGEDALVSRLLGHGASSVSMDVSSERMAVTVDVPAGTDVRGVVDSLRDVAPSVELVGRRSVERDRWDDVGSSLLDGLTDRQREALQTAYVAGFFEWPRTSTGEEVAEMLGISQPTVNRHLRLAQRHLLAQLFDRERGDVGT